MVKNIISLIIIGLFLISLAGAESIGTYKQSSCVSLPQTCGTCTYNNISSVMKPDSTLALSEVAMEKAGTNYNYTFCNTTDLGSYLVNGYGDEDGITSVWIYSFEINSTGEQSSQFVGYYFIILIIFVGILIFGYIIKQESIAILGGLGMMILGVFSYTNGMGIYNNDVTRIASVFISSFGAIVSFIVLLDWFE